MKASRQAIFFGLTAVFFWSTVATAFKLSLQLLSPVELVLYSSVVSTLVIALILILQGKFSLVLHCSAKEYWLSLLLGFLNPFLYYLILFKAYELLPAQQAQPINYTWAITLSLFSVPLLKQKVYPQQWLALLISYCGVVIISTEGKPFSMHFTSGFGVVLALVSTIVWALYWILNTRDTREPVVGLFLNFCCGSFFILLYVLVSHTLRQPPLAGVAGAAYVGVFEMGLCFVLWLKAMKLTDNTATISNLIYLSPFLSLFFIHFLLKEHILPATIVGLGCIVGGLLCQRLR